LRSAAPPRGRPKDEKTIRTYRYALGSLAEHYGDLRLDEFDRPLARRIAAEYPPSRLVVIRNLFADAYDDGLIDHNPFSDLQLVHSDGRADDQVMPEAALHRLADAAIGALGPEYGPMWRTGVLFAAYAGPRAESFCALEWPDVDLAGRTVHFRVVKFDRPYTAILLPHVVDELRRLPRRTVCAASFGHSAASRCARALISTPGTRSARRAGCPTSTSMSCVTGAATTSTSPSDSARRRRARSSATRTAVRSCRLTATAARGRCSDSTVAPSGQPRSVPHRRRARRKARWADGLGP
jgi:integrase